MKKKIIISSSIITIIIITIVTLLLLSNKKEDKITISFDTNGGQYENSIKIDKGTSTTLPKIKREGYDFVGWYTKDGEVYDSKTIITSDTKLVAKWQKKEDCPEIDGGFLKIVKFNTMGGNTINNISICVTCSPETVILPLPIRNGYIFIGWYADSQLTKKVESGNNDINNANWTKVDCYNDETTLYAKWEKIKNN